MENTNLSCPCRPQCPLYGKCRECIAAHAKFYTVPHCVKQMQEEMKKNHLHPSNPHIKKSLPERIADYYSENPSAHLRTAAQALKITHWQLLDGMENALEIPLSELDYIYSQLTQQTEVMLHIDTGSTVLQLVTALPQAVDRNGMKVITAKDENMALTALLFSQSLYGMFLVKENILQDRESYSVAFVDNDEKITLSVYLRDKENTDSSTAGELFNMLWSKYKN